MKKVWVSEMVYDLWSEFLEFKDEMHEWLDREPTKEEADYAFDDETTVDSLTTDDGVEYPSKPDLVWYEYDGEGMFRVFAKFEATEEEAKEFAEKYDASVKEVGEEK